MKLSSCKFILSACALFFFINSSAIKAKSETEFSIGVGAFYNELPYIEWDGEELTPIPLITYINGDFYIDGVDIGYTLFSNGDDESGYYFDILASGRVGFGYENDDSPLLAGMENRDDIAVEAGAKLGFYGAYGLIEISVKQDVADAHDGFIANATYYLPIGDEDLFQFTPYAGVNYQSEDFNNYYYGVKASEARTGRPEFNVDSGTNVFAGVFVSYGLTENWKISANAQYEVLDDVIEDSPIVNEDYIITGLIGISYKF